MNINQGPLIKGALSFYASGLILVAILTAWACWWVAFNVSFMGDFSHLIEFLSS
jgi:hypothetical protein